MESLGLAFWLPILIGILNFIALVAIPYYLQNTIKQIIQEFITQENFYLFVENIFRKKLSHYLESPEFAKDVQPIIKEFIIEDATAEIKIRAIISQEVKEHILDFGQIKILLEQILTNTQLLYDDINKNKASINSILNRFDCLLNQ